MPNFADLYRKSISKLKLDTGQMPSPELLVDLSSARGEYRLEEMMAQLNIIAEEPLHQEQWRDCHYGLFGGHIGSGKSTELKRLEKAITREDRYFTVFVDVTKEVDFSNLQYSDLLLACAKLLFERLDGVGIAIDQVFLTNLENWFDEKFIKQDTSKTYAAELKAGARAKSGIPFLGSVFAGLTTLVKNNSTHKEEIRKTIRNNYSQFVGNFNTLLLRAEEQLRDANQGRKIAFIVDGTDRLNSEDANKFFLQDIYQLRQIESSFVFCTKMSFLNEHSQTSQQFTMKIRLPMLKLNSKDGTEEFTQTRDCLREFVNKRVDPEYFDNNQEVQDYLIQHSGGHLRDLVRLLNQCVIDTYGTRSIDMNIAQKAVKKLASELRRFIQEEDWETLVTIDSSPESYTETSERTARLLDDLVLLEYNSYWWRTHPLVRTLDGYKNAQEKYQA